MFRERLRKDGKPLFKSQVDLAEQVKKAPGCGFEDTEVATIRVFLNQVLLPSGIPRSRPLSPNLKNAISWAVGERLSGNGKTKSTLERLWAAFDEIKDKKSAPKAVDERIEWPEFYDAAHEAKTHIIFTPSPAEVRADDRHAEQLTREIIRRAFDPDTAEDDVKYEFFIFDAAEADRMRRILVSSIESTVNSAKGSELEAWALLKGAEDSGRFAVYHFANDLWLPSMAFFDPETAGIKGFGLSYHTNDTISVIRFNDEELKTWYKRMYLRIKRGELKKVIQQVNDYPSKILESSPERKHAVA